MPKMPKKTSRKSGQRAQRITVSIHGGGIDVDASFTTIGDLATRLASTLSRVTTPPIVESASVIDPASFVSSAGDMSPEAISYVTAQVAALEQQIPKMNESSIRLIGVFLSRLQATAEAAFRHGVHAKPPTDAPSQQPEASA